MARRYKRILESAKYYAAIDNYIKYITDASKRGSKVGQGKPRPESIRLYLEPFGQDLTTGQKVRASAALPTWDKVKGVGAVSSRVAATAPTDADNILRLEGFKPAKVAVVSGRSDKGVAKTSAVTGLKYLSYGGSSTSFPFGKTSDTDSESGAFEAIKAALQGGNSFSNATFSHIQEVI